MMGESGTIDNNVQIVLDAVTVVETKRGVRPPCPRLSLKNNVLMFGVCGMTRVHKESKGQENAFDTSKVETVLMRMYDWK